MIRDLASGGRKTGCRVIIESHMRSISREYPDTHAPAMSSPKEAESFIAAAQLYLGEFGYMTEEAYDVASMLDAEVYGVDEEGFVCYPSLDDLEL